MYKKILVPIDGSEQSIYTLQEAIKLASEWGKDVHLTVFHATLPITMSELTLCTDIDQLRAETGQAIVAAAEPLLAGVPFSHDSVYQDGDPAHLICTKAQSEGYDLIVIGSRGHGLFRELLLGSVSHKVVQHAHCPVLVVRR